MSRLHKNVLGDPSGIVGNLVFRRRRGKVFVYTRPIPFEITQSESLTAVQNKFAFLRRMAACTAKNQLLKFLWNNSDLPGGIGFERQMTANSPVYNNDRDISQLKLVPSAELFQAELLECSYGNNFLDVTISNAGAGIADDSCCVISPHGMIMLTDGDPEDPPYLFIPLTAKQESLTGGNTYPFRLYLDYQDVGRYRAGTFILCLIIMDRLGTPLLFSKNIMGTVEFNG